MYTLRLHKVWLLWICIPSLRPATERDLSSGWAGTATSLEDALTIGKIRFRKIFRTVRVKYAISELGAVNVSSRWIITASLKKFLGSAGECTRAHVPQPIKLIMLRYIV